MDKQERDDAQRILATPVADILGSRGIQVRGPGAQGFLNLSRCPWCGHGTESAPNWQCGVKETLAGRYFRRAFKCFHPADGPGGDSPEYIDVLERLGALSVDQVRWLRERRDERRTHAPTEVSSPAPVGSLKLADPTYSSRLTRRLRANKIALTWLYETRGFSPSVVDYFRLGLSEEYKPYKSNSPLTANALVAPLRATDGRFYGKYVYYHVPGVTTDNRDKPRKAWSAGEVRTYCSRGFPESREHTYLFVTDGLKDLWAIWSKLQQAELGKHVVLITSTNGGGGIPEEWHSPNFWEGWREVFLGHDNDEPGKTGLKAGDEHAKAIARLAQRETKRVWPIGVKDWNDFFLAGKSIDDFERLLDSAVAIGHEQLAHSGELGYQAAKPIDVNGAYHGGHLYAVVRIVDRQKVPESSDIAERYRTIILRSDRSSHVVRVSRSPDGTPKHDRVHRLYPDGSLVTGMPQHNQYLTWTYESIERYLAGTSRTPPLAELFAQVLAHLKGSVWLPFEHDLTMLACAVIATYVQRVFDAVPLFLANGEPGSGKTQLAAAMCQLAANSPTPIGKISAASIARLIDQSRGFVALDDLEMRGANDGDPQYGDLVQCIKVSYKKDSAIKVWTDPKTMEVRRLDFYGMKLINNTTGVDHILGSRMFVVRTRQMPQGRSLAGSPLDDRQLADLRDHLYTWAFENVKAVASMYSRLHPNQSTRSEEIAAPLRVIARLVGDQGVEETLEAAVQAQRTLSWQPETSDEVLTEALRDIVAEAVSSRGVVPMVSPTELIMRMKLLTDDTFGKRFTNQLSEIESPEWAGRRLKQSFAEPDCSQLRVQMFGKCIRSYKLSASAVARLSNDWANLAHEADPKAFCRGCKTCVYAAVCGMRVVRESRDAR